MSYNIYSLKIDQQDMARQHEAATHKKAMGDNQHP